MPESKTFKVLCWGDCKKFPEIGKCSLTWNDERTGAPKKAFEGEIRDDIPLRSWLWLLRDGFIENVTDGETK